MNTLSWFLYLAELVDRLHQLTVAVSMLGFTIMLILTMGIVMENYNKKFLFGWLLVCFTILVAVITPSKNTLYAIAASELGEKALQTSLAKKTVTAIETWIDSQVKK